MRITIFGGTGMLGKALVRQWSGEEITVLGTAHADIRNPDQVAEAIRHSKPDWVVLCAAYTDVDGCELNPALASNVNTYGALNVAKVAAEAGSRLLFISTDYVFDGRKSTPYEVNDKRNPLNVYGKTKAEAEEKISEVLPECCMVRTSWLFGLDGKCFPETIFKLASSRHEIEVVNDQRGRPTYTVDLAEAIIKLCRADAGGIIHCATSGDCTWYEFACEIIKQSSLKSTVRPTTSDKYIRAAERPPYSVLSGESLRRHGIEMRPWQKALSDYLGRRSVSAP